MIKKITSFFKSKKSPRNEEYSGFSDFFLRASHDEKKRVMIEAAKKSNEDQFKIFTEARVRTKG